MGSFTTFWDTVQKEIDQLIDENTGLIASQYTTSRNCVICGSGKKEFLFNKYGFAHVRCSDCDLIYVDPVLNKESLKKMYLASESFDYFLEIMTQQAKKRRDEKSQLIVRRIDARQKLPIKSWLDIGCGCGALLKAARQKGYIISGVEPSITCRNNLKEELQIEIHEDIKNIGFQEGSYSVITLKQVIEHLSDPKEVIEQAYKLLKPNGLLWIATPNTNGFGMSLMKASHPSYQRGHIVMFNKDNISRLLSNVGFKNIKISTCSLKTHHLISFLCRKKDVKKDVFKKVDQLPKEGGFMRLVYYNFIEPFVNVVVRLAGKGDCLEVFAYK